MKAIVTAAEMQAIDARTIADVGLPGSVLMENAGRAVADDVLACDPAPGHVAVVCGTGNNGGDGFVVARVLGERGFACTVFLAGTEGSLKGDALLHFLAFTRLGGRVVSVASSAEVREAASAVSNSAVIVDALFGTGLTRAVAGHHAALIDVINSSRGTVVAVDVPSGLSADTGEKLGATVVARRTVTMAFHKVATASSPGFACCGDVRVAEIGIPGAFGAEASLWLAEDADVAAMLPAASALDYKNSRGHALIIAGSPGKWGAGRLAAMASLRAGAGLVTLASEDCDSHAPDAVMTARLDQSVETLSLGKSAIAIGPGLSPGQPGLQAVMATLSLPMPVVIDADGLNHLVDNLEGLRNRQHPTVLTPHPGEAARLLGTSAAVIEGDRAAAVRRLRNRTNAVVVLKGARTLVAWSDTTWVVPTGGPGLATAGTGDVLTGVIAALLAQGLSAQHAALAGAYIHGLAGDFATQSKGRRGVVANDVIAALPSARHRLRE